MRRMSFPDLVARYRELPANMQLEIHKDLNDELPLMPNRIKSEKEYRKYLRARYTDLPQPMTDKKAVKEVLDKYMRLADILVPSPGEFEKKVIALGNLSKEQWRGTAPFKQLRVDYVHPLAYGAIDNKFLYIVDRRGFLVISNKHDGHVVHRVDLQSEIRGLQDHEGIGSVAVDDEYLYFSDTFDKRIYVFEKGDVELEHWLANSHNVNVNFDFPMKLAVDPGELFSLRFDGVFTSFDTLRWVATYHGTRRSPVVGDVADRIFGPGVNTLFNPLSIAVDDNYIYIGDTGRDSAALADRGRIQKINRQTDEVVWFVYNPQHGEVIPAGLKSYDKLVLDEEFIYAKKRDTIQPKTQILAQTSNARSSGHVHFYH